MTIPFHSVFFDYFTPGFEFVSSKEFNICNFVLPIYVEDFLDYSSLKDINFLLLCEALLD